MISNSPDVFSVNAVIAHWLAIGGTFTVASGNELTKPRQNMKVKKDPLAFFQRFSRSIMH